MSATSETPIEPAVHGSTGVATGNPSAGPPVTAPSSGSQHTAQDELPTPKYLDPNWIKEGVPDTKFYKDYPPDAWGQEPAPNARVWKIYRDEMTNADSETLKSWNGTLDVLLIFAGLFSAVSTAFVIESYQALQPDYTEYIANVLYATATSNLAVNGVISLPTVPSMGPPDGFVHPSATQRWTNGLWFTSLVVSLTVALLCILIKQWLDQYQARTTRSAPSLQGWARRHQIYYRGLYVWRVPALISVLPLFLHVSLFLFFSGLVLFLRPLDVAIANTLLAILILTLIFYVLSLAIPAWCIDCPSYTPLLAQARSLITLGLRVLVYLIGLLRAWSWYANIYRWCGRQFSENMTTRIKFALFRARGVLEKLHNRSRQCLARETSVVDAQHSILDGRALSTLLVSTNDPDVIDAGVEAIGAISISAGPTLEFLRREGPLDPISEHTNRDVLNTGATSSAFAAMTDARRARTYWTLVLMPEWNRGQPRSMLNLYHFLGMDGVLIQLMEISQARPGNFFPGNLFHDNTGVAETVDSCRRLFSAHALNLLPQEDNIIGYAHDGLILRETQTQSIPGLTRGTCLLFLHVMNNLNCFHHWPTLADHAKAFISLAFCAGDFARAEPHEQAVAIQNLLVALQSMFGWPPIRNAPTENADEVNLNTLDRLFAFLATHQLRLLSDEDTGLPFINHLGLVSQSLCMPLQYRLDSRRPFPGLIALTLSSNFEKYCSKIGFYAYVDVLSCAVPPSDEDAESSQQYWTCVAMLLKQLGHVSMRKFKFDDFLGEPKRAITVFARASDVIFSKFLECTAGMSSWAGVYEVAYGLSCLLCHRLRVRPIDTGDVQLLFTGTLLRKKFIGAIRKIAKDLHRQRTLKMAKHCARLSLDGMLQICDELENPSEWWLHLDQNELDFVGEIRRGLQSGGELRSECDSSCDCMPQPEVQPPAQPTTGTTRWENPVPGSVSAVGDSEFVV